MAQICRERRQRFDTVKQTVDVHKGAAFRGASCAQEYSKEGREIVGENEVAFFFLLYFFWWFCSYFFVKCGTKKRKAIKEPLERGEMYRLRKYVRP